jgi:hypothetical protein
MMFWIEDNFDGDKSSVECTFYSMGGATSAEIQAKYAEMLKQKGETND